MAVPQLGERYRQATREELEARGVQFDGDCVIHPVGLKVRIGDGIRNYENEELHIRIPLESVLLDSETGDLSLPNPIDP